MWKVTAFDPLATPSSIIYRKFGNNGEIIDRDTENYIFTELSKKGVGPSVYGGDQRMRLEEFCESRTLNPSEISDKSIRRSVAKSLANLHQIQFEGLNKTPMFLGTLQESGTLIKLVEEKSLRGIYSSMEERWLKEILSLVSEDEISFLKEILPKGENSVVFSHNDLHSQNILLLHKNQEIKLIDYEYSSYNYRGYDIANFFNESMMDYSNPEYPYYTLDESKYPNSDDLIDFIKYYLFFVKFRENNLDETLALNDDYYFKQIIVENSNLEEFDGEVDEIFREVKICAMLSHYYWTLWSVVMSKNPEIQLDYLHYAYKRLNVYKELKQDYFTTKSSDVQSVLVNE